MTELDEEDRIDKVFGLLKSAPPVIPTEEGDSHRESPRSGGDLLSALRPNFLELAIS